jgi:hypothetical protein
MDPSRPQSPLADALQWVARMTSAALMMVLPGLFGQWVDHTLGTSWFALLGFGVGIAGSLVYLLAVTSTLSRHKDGSQDQNNGDSAP